MSLMKCRLALEELGSSFGCMNHRVSLKSCRTCVAYSLYIGVCPDLVTIGKPMGNGHPVSGVVTTEAIASKYMEKVDSAVMPQVSNSC